MAETKLFTNDINNTLVSVVDSNVTATSTTLNSSFGSVLFSAGKTGVGILSYTINNNLVDQNTLIVANAYNMTTASNFSVTIPNGGGSFTLTFAIATVFAANARINFALIKSS